MERTMDVKGTGRASASPDWIEISLTLSFRHRKYDTVMELEALGLDDLYNKIEKVGILHKDIKTTYFNVDTTYTQCRDGNGNSERKLSGYEVSHHLSISFEKDMKKLSSVLGAISQCISRPELSIRFFLHDDRAIRNEVLRNAVENAKEKAKVLSEASGVKLGDIISVSHDWSDINFSSSTRFDKCMDISPLSDKGLEMEAEDIEVSDNVSIVWRIE